MPLADGDQDMPRESVITGSAVAGVVVGLLVLLYGEATPNDEFVTIGGVIVLAAVGLLTVFVSGLE